MLFIRYVLSTGYESLDRIWSIGSGIINNANSSVGRTFVRVVHQVCSLDRIRISRPNLIDWIRNNQQRQQLSRTNAWMQRLISWVRRRGGTGKELRRWMGENKNFFLFRKNRDQFFYSRWVRYFFSPGRSERIELISFVSRKRRNSVLTGKEQIQGSMESMENAFYIFTSGSMWSYCSATISRWMPITEWYTEMLHPRPYRILQ